MRVLVLHQSTSSSVGLYVVILYEAHNSCFICVLYDVVCTELGAVVMFHHGTMQWKQLTALM